MNRREIRLYSPAIGTEGTVLAYGHWGRPVLAFPSEQGPLAVRGARHGRRRSEGCSTRGRVKLYCVELRLGELAGAALPPEERARRHGATRTGSSTRSCRSSATTAAARGDRRQRPELRRLPRRELRAPARRPVPARDLPERRLRRLAPIGWGERGDAAYFNNPADYVEHMHGDHLDWLRGRVSLLLVCGQGQWEDTTGALESTKQLRRAAGARRASATSSTSGATTCRTTGPRGARSSRTICRASAEGPARRAAAVPLA